MPLLHAHLRALLGPLSAQVAALASAAQVRDLSVGGVLLREGQHWQHLWWVAEGGLRMYYLDRRAKSSNKNFYLRGAMFWPITPALAQRPVDFWIEALGPTQVWGIPWAAWQVACKGWPAWQEWERRTLVLLLEEKMRREQRLLQDSATQRYQALCAERPDWARDIALRHIASYLGVTDVALSRIRRRLNQG